MLSVRITQTKHKIHSTSRIGQNYKNNNNDIEIVIVIIILLTDFLMIHKFCDEKPARNSHILAHNSLGSDFLNYKISCTNN